MRLIGDLHGEFDKLVSKIKQLRILGEILIQVGDFGLGFKKEEADRKLQEEKATAEAATNDNKTKKTKSFKPMKTFKRLFTKKACAVSAC